MAIRIPFYDSQAGMTLESAAAALPMESVEAAGIPGARLSKAGGQLEAVASGIVQELRRGRDIDDLAAMTLKMHQGLNQIGNELQADPGKPEEWAGKFEEKAAALQKEIMALGGSDRARAKANAHWSEVFPGKLQDITAKGRVQEAKNFAAGFDEKYPQYADLYAQAGDELSRQQIKGTVDNYIMAAVSAGVLAPEKGAIARQNFIPEAMKQRVLADLDRDPAGTQARLNDPEKNYPGLRPGDVNSLRGTASAALHRNQDENVLKVDQAFDAGTLTPGLLTQMRDARTISISTYRKYDAALKGQGGERDQDYLTQLWIKANQGRLSDKEEVYNGLRAGKFTVKEADYLFRTQEAATRGEAPDDMKFLKNPLFRLAVQDLERRLKPLDDSVEERMRKVTGQVRKEPLPSLAAVRQLTEACQEADRNGQLTNKFIEEKVEEIIKPYRRQQAEEAVKKPGWFRGLFGGGEATSIPTLPPPGGGGKTPAGGIRGMGAGGMETITRDGKTYRVLTIGGKKMVDPNPLP